MFLPGESQGWGSLVGCGLWDRIELHTTEATQQQQQQQQNLGQHLMIRHIPNISVAKCMNVHLEYAD